MDVPKVLDVRVEARGLGESDGVGKSIDLDGSIFDCEVAKGVGCEGDDGRWFSDISALAEGD